MSTPVEEVDNPFGDRSAMTDSPKQHTPGSSGVLTSTEGGTPNDRPGQSKKKRVGFTGSDAGDRSQRSSWVGAFEDGTASPTHLSPNLSPEVSASNTPLHSHARSSSGDHLLSAASKSHLPELSQQQTDQIRGSLAQSLSVPRPRPAIRLSGPRLEEPLPDDDALEPDDDGRRAVRRRRAQEAFERGKRLENDERIMSEPNSRHVSPERAQRIPSIVADGIPLQNLHHMEDDDIHGTARSTQQQATARLEAQKLVRRHTTAKAPFQVDSGSGTRSGAVTPTEDQDFMEDYHPRPQHYRGGILGNLLKLYNEPQHNQGHTHSPPGSYPKPHIRSRSSGEWNRSAMSTPQQSPPESGSSTPINGRSHWYFSRSKNQSTSSLATLIGSSASFGAPGNARFNEQVHQKLKEEQARQAKRPGLGKRTRSSGMFNKFAKNREYKIIDHIAETMARHKYLMKLCTALMQYGAPTHRLEEYMRMSARVLETDAQFLYIPGAMIMSFEDKDTHTSEVKLVKVAQGLDLGKLRDVHEVYKEVVHDKVGVEDATRRLREITGSKDKHNRLFRIPVYGLAAVCVGPFAFGARLIDLPVAFILGCILGVLQLYVAPQSDLYANVFEISAAVITSFLARAFGSIRGGDLFCFSALAQSSIALILPGYTVLCASLELQSRSIVAGSVRMVYAIIYSLFLGFGITVGTAIYGMIDSNATSETTCRKPISEYWFFFFVPGFTMCLIIINQAKWKQAPMMMIIAFAGYIVNYFSSRKFSGNTQISNTLGALAIGVMANLYSRIGGRVENMALDLWEVRLRPRWKSFRKHVFGFQGRYKTPKSMEEGTAGDHESIYMPKARRVGYSLAAAAMLPAIFVQVPSGLAVNGSLVSGIASANQITGNATNGTQVVNTTSLADASALNSIAFTVGYSVIQVAIGITVGLFLSAIVVYPFGKRRSGLFSF